MKEGEVWVDGIGTIALLCQGRPTRATYSVAAQTGGVAQTHADHYQEATIHGRNNHCKRSH